MLNNVNNVVCDIYVNNKILINQQLIQQNSDSENKY